jgi:uridine kinase
MVRIASSDWPLRGRLPVKFVAIDGHGGSGKSSLAELLSERLGAEIVHTDDFASWDDPGGWWPLVIDRVFTPITAGARTIGYPRSKWWEDHRPEPVLAQAVTPIMILEGVGSLRTELRPYISFGIFVDAPDDVCLRRGLARDAGHDGKSDEEIRAMWQGWLDYENDYLDRDRPIDHADLVIDGTKPFDGQLHSLR